MLTTDEIIATCNLQGVDKESLYKFAGLIRMQDRAEHHTQRMNGLHKEIIDFNARVSRLEDSRRDVNKSYNRAIATLSKRVVELERKLHDDSR